MYTTLSQISFSRSLQNNIFVNMCDDIVAIIDDVEHDIKCELFEESLDMFKVHLSILKQIMPPEGEHHLTATIYEKAEERKNAARNIYYSVKGNSFSIDPVKRDIARRFMHWYGFYIDEFLKGTRDEVTTRVNQLAKDIDENNNIREYIEYLELEEQINDLISINPEITKLNFKRTEDRAKRNLRRVDSVQVRKDASIALRFLLRDIERQVYSNGIGIANHLILAITDVMDRARTIQKRKNTMMKKKKSKVMAAPGDVDNKGEYNSSEE